MQGVTWTGLRVGVEVWGWLIMASVWCFVECARNHKESFTEGNDTCEWASKCL